MRFQNGIGFSCSKLDRDVSTPLPRKRLWTPSSLFSA